LLTGNWDVELSNSIRRDTAIAPLRYALQGITLLGDARTQMAVELGALVFGNERERRETKLAMVSWGATGLLTLGLKGIVNRPRPPPEENGRWDSSFPSGHTSSYFALATVGACKYPKLVLPLAVVGAGVAYSRVLLGKHYPTDVLAGAVLGIGIGLLTVKLESQLRRIPFMR
jgi:membrane-associated phospholipid phosphatase